MTKFRANLIDEPLTPHEALMNLADALGRYMALREMREAKEATAVKQLTSTGVEENPPESE